MRCCDTRAWRRPSRLDAALKLAILGRCIGSTKLSLHRLTGLALRARRRGRRLAQQVYRQVDKNGKVTFSDRAPTASTDAGRGLAGVGASHARRNAGLPYELRQVAQRYPVTLYSSDECGPCGTARSLLITRGVSVRGTHRQEQRGRRGAAAPERPELAAAADHRVAAAQGLLGCRVVAVPRRGRLSQEQQPARRLPQRPPREPLVAQQAAPAPRAAAAPRRTAGAAARRIERPSAEQPGRHQVLSQAARAAFHS